MSQSPEPYLRPLDLLPPGYSKFLGDIVARWALIEHVLSGCAYELLRINYKQGRVAVREPRAEERLTMILQLADLRGVSLKGDWATLKSDLQEAQRSRDMLAHSVWCILEGTDQVFISQTTGNWSPPQMKGRISRKIIPEAMPWPLTSFREPMVLQGTILQRLYRLQREIDDALAPLPDIPPG